MERRGGVRYDRARVTEEAGRFGGHSGRWIPIVLALLVFGAGLTGVGLAGMGGSRETVSVMLLDGKLVVSTQRFTAGPVTFVVRNGGRRTHGLALMGVGFATRKTPTLAAGATAKLSVTLRPGMYHVWDPVRGAMSGATMLQARSVGASANSPGMSGSSGSSTIIHVGSASGKGSSIMTMTMPMDPNDPCAGH